MKDKEVLEKILLSDNIEQYKETIFEIIPELKKEEDFEQKSVWHCFDVFNHTLNAIYSCDKNFSDRLILLLHDIGKPFSYQDEEDVRHFKNHALMSMIISKKILERLGYSKEELDEMLMLIGEHSTKIDTNNITDKNIEYYKRLLKIQKCDASAYEKEHAKIILNELKQVETYILQYEKSNKSNKNMI